MALNFENKALVPWNWFLDPKILSINPKLSDNIFADSMCNYFYLLQECHQVCDLLANEIINQPSEIMFSAVQTVSVCMDTVCD